MLERSGASPAATSSKLARVLGDVSTAQTDGRSTNVVKPREAAHLLLTLVSEQREELLRQDAGVRAETPEAVHKRRIAARRMRSALTTYRKVLDPAAANALREELRWLCQAPAEARDAQVLREHLDGVLASEEPELVLGPVARRIDNELQAAHTAGLDEARQALDSDRYFRLLDALDGFVADPPLAPKAHTAARKLVPRLLTRDFKKLRTAVRDVERAEDPRTRDLALHEARKEAKRLRYAAESAIPAFGSRAKRYAAKVKNIQQSLGVHQDTVVARQVLREYGVQAHLSGENGFAFGRLHALEQWHADQSELEFRASWEALPQEDPPLDQGLGPPNDGEGSRRRTSTPIEQHRPSAVVAGPSAKAMPTSVPGESRSASCVGRRRAFTPASLPAVARGRPRADRKAGPGGTVRRAGLGRGARA